MSVIRPRRRGAPGQCCDSYSVPVGSNNIISLIRTYALLSSLAKLESQKICEPTKAGMARAKANGIKVGRPKLEIEFVQRAKKGETPYAIAKALGIDRHTAAKYAHLLA